jgi:predicted ATP-grasp superfamily ATP-dependent carboligase
MIPEQASLSVMVAGMELKDVISIVSLILTIIIATFTFRFNSEQTKIKHVLKHDIMNRFLSCYRDINQLNDYI